MYTVLAAGPVLFLGWIAVTARTAFFEWHPAEYGNTIHKDWLAYTEPVRKVPLEVEPSSHPDWLKDATALWLRDYRAGRLRNIPIADITDLASDGPRGELMTARNLVIVHNIQVASQAERAGDYKRAIETSLDVMELAQINKYSTPIAIYESSRVQTLTLEKLNRLLPLSPESWDLTVLRLSKVAPKADRFRHVLSRIQMMYRLPNTNPSKVPFTEGASKAWNCLIEGQSLSTTDVLQMTAVSSIDEPEAEVLGTLIVAKDALGRENQLNYMISLFIGELQGKPQDQSDSAKKPLLLVSTSTLNGARTPGSSSTGTPGSTDQLSLLALSAGKRTGTR